MDSTAAITETCRGVAPTSRIAANRCSRRAADSRVAVPMKMSTGNKQRQRHHRQDQVDAVAFMPTAGQALALPLQPLGGVVAIAVARTAPGAWASWAAVCPMTMTSEFGDGSAAAPIVPIWCPGYRSPSWSAGVLRSSAASAGEA